MDVFKKNIGIPSFVFIIVIMFILAVSFFGLYYLYDSSSKWSAIYAGLFTAFSVATVQLFISYYEHKRLNKYEEMGVKDIVKQRRGKDYYGKIIRNCKKEVSLMGNTAARFMSDFADSDASDNDALIQAMNKGANIRILVPKPEHLNEAQAFQVNNETIPLFNRLNQSHKERVQLKFYDSPPLHSIMILDDLCIVGPVFSGVKSENTPAITFSKDSDFVRPYIQYYENIWDQAKENAK